MTKSTDTFDWEGITIEVKFDTETYGCNSHDFEIAHLEVRAINPEKSPLPITETGYRSRFLNEEEVESTGGVEAFIRTWLEHEAKSDAWQSYFAESCQPCLF